MTTRTRNITTARNDAGAAEQGERPDQRLSADSTERFKDVAVAEAEGYALQFGCVSGDDSGAMGLHYVNGDLVNSGVLDATRPQIVIYEPTAGRKPEADRRRLSGYRRRVECEALGSAGAHGTALSFVRHPQSFRAAGVLHAACLGMEGQSERRVRELAPNVSCESFAGQNH